jgi:hypothetical protein
VNASIDQLLPLASVSVVAHGTDIPMALAWAAAVAKLVASRVSAAAVARVVGRIFNAVAPLLRPGRAMLWYRRRDTST